MRLRALVPTWGVLFLFLLPACSNSNSGLGFEPDKLVDRDPKKGDDNPDGDLEDTDTDLTPDVTDEDGDGYDVAVDCDDEDATTHPFADEACDGIDNDCNGVVPEMEFDLDNDGTVECEEVCGAGPLPGYVNTNPQCEYTPSGSGTPFIAQVEWAMTHAMVDPNTGNSFPAYTFSAFPDYGGVFQAPMVMHATDDNYDGQANEEDTPDIVVNMAHADASVTDGVLRLISGDGSQEWDAVHWTTFTNANGTFDYAPYHYAGLAVGNFDSDDSIEIATLVQRKSDGTCWPAYYQVTQTGTNVKIELERMYEASNYNCAAHAPSYADIDDDGRVELIYGKGVFDAPTFTQDWYGASSGGRGWYPQIFYTDGYWNSGYHSFAYDLDGDGQFMEVLGGYTAYTHDGGLFCELGSYDSTGAWVHGRDGYPAVADIVGDDGEPEIVITGNNYVAVYHGVPDHDPNGLKRCVQIAEVPNDPHLDPAVAGRFPTHPNCDTTADSFGGQPTVADFDGDGDNEIAVAGACYYSVYRFNNGTLERYAMAETKDWSSASTGSTVFDFNGDGENEIVFSDEDALYVWGIDPSPGLEPWQRLYEYLKDTNHKSWTVHEYPLVADVDGDGKAEIVVTNSQLLENNSWWGIYVLGALDDDWVTARKVWHQHAYYVTNVEDDGSVGYCAPNYAPYTAADHNSFRTQAPGSHGTLAASDLQITAEPPCQEGCGDINVWVQVANEGAFVSATPDVTIGLYGVSANGARTLLDSTTFGAYLHPARVSPGYLFEVSGWDSYDHLVAVVDDPNISGPFGGDGLAKECDETDNEVTISLANLCP